MIIEISTEDFGGERETIDGAVVSGFEGIVTGLGFFIVEEESSFSSVLQLEQIKSKHKMDKSLIKKDGILIVCLLNFNYSKFSNHDPAVSAEVVALIPYITTNYAASPCLSFFVFLGLRVTSITTSQHLILPDHRSGRVSRAVL